MAVIQTNHKLFQKMMESEQPVLVDFCAPWCSYCRRIAPVYEKIAQEYDGRLLVASVNVDEEPFLAEQEQIEILPTLVLYQNGQAISSIVSPESKGMIEDLLRGVLTL